MTSGGVPDGFPKLDLDLESAGNLIGRAMRARVWHRVELGHRATLRVVSWVVRKGESGLVQRVRRNLSIRGMVAAAANAVLQALREVPGALPFRVRAFLEGARIANHRIQAYDGHGVFRWAPWVRAWLQDEGVVIYLGANSLDSPRYGRL